MPFVSMAHKAKMKALLAAGEITQAQYDEMDRETPEGASLPKRKGEGETPQSPGAKVKKISPFW